MGKIIIGVAVVFSCLTTMAAAVDWQLYNIQKVNDSNVTVDANNYSTFTAYLVDSSMSVDSFFKALGDGTLASSGKVYETTALSRVAMGGNVRVYMSGGTTDYTIGTPYSLYTIVLNEDASYYLATDVKTDTPVEGLANLNMKWSNAADVGVKWTATIPEPTSGLLLLVGGALLALRRKQK